MNSPLCPNDPLPTGLAARLDPVCDAFEAELRAGRSPCVEDYLQRAAEPDRPALRRELLALDLEYRAQGPGPAAPIPAAVEGFPGAQQGRASLTDPAAPAPSAAASATIACPGPGLWAGRYEILGELGRGGMGVVYKARQVQLKRLVALKMIVAGLHARPRERARFQAEAEAIARLRHPNIVQIHEIGEQQGRPYFSLEFVEGGSLDKFLNGTPRPGRAAAALVQTLARAVQAAHEHGVVHRDLKPANVLLAPDGTPKITDFGLAKRLDDEALRTQSGDVMGTPSYMAPEQAAGRSREIGPAADVWALGAILYELLTGRPPFKGSTALETLALVCTQEPVPPGQLQPKVPRDLETICLKCLQKEPPRRYGTAAALANDLLRFLAGEPIQARPVGGVERTWRWCRRNPVVAALGLAVALVLGTALALTQVLGLAVALALVLGTALAWVLAVRAREAELQARTERDEKEQQRLWAVANEGKARQAAEAEKRARQQAAVAARAERLAKEAAQKRLEQVTKVNALLGSIFWDLNPQSEEKEGPLLSARLGTRLDQAAISLEGEVTGDPLMVAQLQVVLGRALAGLGYPQRAVGLLLKALHTFQAHRGPEPTDTLSAMDSLALAYRATGQMDKALPLLEQVLAKRKAEPGPDHPDTLVTMSDLAFALKQARQYDRALPLYRELLDRQSHKLPGEHSEQTSILNQIGACLLALGRAAEAEPLLREALQVGAKKQPASWRTFVARSLLGDSLLTQKKYAEAEPLLLQGYQGLKQRQPQIPAQEHTVLSEALVRLVRFYEAAGQKDRAAAWRKQLQEQTEREKK